MILFCTTEKQNQRQRYLHEQIRLDKIQRKTLSVLYWIFFPLLNPLIEINESKFNPIGLSLSFTSWDCNVFKMWVKHRLWDRLFWVSKLRQQGSPTIFAGWRDPTISCNVMLQSQEINAIGMRFGCFPVPEYTLLLRGTYDR
jgi:hypothetical protein